LLRPGWRREAGGERSGDGDRFPPVGPLDLAKGLGFDPGTLGVPALSVRELSCKEEAGALGDLSV